ncbi:hypothetical protein PG995_002968 [Apiospora arundinis]
MPSRNAVAAAGHLPPTSHGAIIGVVTISIALITTMVMARMYTRFRVHRQLWWDDWTMVAGFAGTLGMCVLDFVMMQYGGGFAIVFNIYQIVARLSILLVKLSILLLYIRIFFPVGVDRKGTSWWVIQGVMWMNVAYTIALVLALALQCVPYGRPWGNSCVNQWLVLVFASIVNVISDFAVFLTPIAAVWRLQVSSSKKWAVISLFAFGTLAPFVSIARLVYQIVTADSEDKTVIYLVCGVLATAEQVVGIIVGCLPVASSWLIQHMRKIRTGKFGVYDASQRLWAERRNVPRSKAPKPRQHAARADPYEVTDAVTGTSQEMLYSSPECERANQSIVMGP